MIFPNDPPTAPDGTELSLEDWERLRTEARNDLFFMAKGILRYDLISPRTHKAFCEFIQKPKPNRKLALMPRSHLKTTIATISDSIREIAKNPNIRILIANETAKNAKLMLQEIKNHFEQNERFRMFFPDLIPESFARAVWNAEEIQVPRTAIWREPTISTTGTGGTVVSRHFDLMKFDDLVGEEALKSPTVMADAISWLNHSVSLLVNAYDSRMHLIGTRWALSDVYSHAMQKMGFETFLRKAIVMGPGGPEPFFPEQVSMEFLASILETDPFQWATQYANDPFDAADSDFKQEWLQYYEIAPDGDIRYRDEEGRLSIQEFEKLEIFAHIDVSMGETASADATGVIVAGVNSKGQVFILEAYKDRITPDIQVEKIFEIHNRYSPKLISIEAVGYQKALQYFVEKEMRRRNTYIRLEAYKPPRNRNKEARIRQTLQPYFSQNMIFIRNNMFDLVEEYTSFGRSHPDLMDALAQGPGYWKAPMDDAGLERLRRLRTEYTAQPRGLTGYGI